METDATMQNTVMKMLEGYSADLISLLNNSSVSSSLDVGQTSIVEDTNRLLSSLISAPATVDSKAGYELFITNLPPEASEIELILLFQSCGEMTSCNLKGKFKGQKFAYICYAKMEDAKKAIDKMNGTKIGENRIHVKWSDRNSKKAKIEIESNTKQSNPTKFKEQPRVEKVKSSMEHPSKRKKSDLEITAVNPLFQSPIKKKTFHNKMSEGLLKLSNFQEESDEEPDNSSSASNPKPESKTTATQPIVSSKVSSHIEVEQMNNSSKLQSDQLIKELEELKSKVIRLENEKNNENKLKDAELNKLRAQVETENKKNEELRQKIDDLKNQPVTNTPSMEDFETLKVKVERLEQEKQITEKSSIAKTEPNDVATNDKDKAVKESNEVESKSNDEKNLSDIDVCILNLSQTINEHFKNLAGKLMSGQKEKEEEQMMERLRSLEPIQAVIYEKLRWILSIGGNPNEGALRSASKVSKHFPFLLAFLGFNYHDLIMMSIGMEKEISPAEGATRLAKWFNYVLKEKGHINKRIWPSSLSTNMVATILAEHFSTSSRNKNSLKPTKAEMNPALNPLVLPNSNKMSKSSRSQIDNDVSIVGEFSQENSYVAKNFIDNAYKKPAKGCSMLSNIGAMHIPPPFPPAPFPSHVDVRTVGSSKRKENQNGGKNNFSRQQCQDMLCSKDKRWSR